MSFEGVEKKFELLVSNSGFPLREIDADFWEHIVTSAGATIVSRISNEYCNAYLLSESSLFVYDDRVVMITCGTTSLVSAIIALLNRVAFADLKTLIYERKNENFPDLQPSNFDQDVSLLREHIPGKTLLFGEKRGHYVLLFHLDKPFIADPTDTTLEILMYDIDPPRRSLFCRGSQLSDEQRKAYAAVHKILPGFQIDDYFFDPVGYSLNAIRGKEYYTVHITPEHRGSYVSFETNVLLRGDLLQHLVDQTVGIFQPARFDVVAFAQDAVLSSPPEHYLLQNNSVENLQCGYVVHYLHLDRARERQTASSLADSDGAQPSPTE